MNVLSVKAGSSIKLAPLGGIDDHAHVFDQASIDAVNAALAVRRPLLIRGEPGIGKSQLARAAALKLRRAYLPHVVDIRTEARDLLWEFDAIARLAQAQISGALGEDEALVRKRLADENFLKPGPLWWAFDWKKASDQAKIVGLGPPKQLDDEFPKNGEGAPSHGSVVLVDEIDKAETDVPNGLLEALGSGTFAPMGGPARIFVGAIPPLVLITSNAERVLPDAFVRRCLVLHLTLPDDDRGELLEMLIERGKAHFPKMERRVLKAAAEQLAEDREQAKEKRLSPKPGQAEYFDLLRALNEIQERGAQAQIGAIEAIRPFILQKHRGSL